MTKWTAGALALGFALWSAGASAQTKVSIGISGWTGFAPLVLAKEAGIFAKNGVDATIKKIPQGTRHLAIASGDVQCAATTVETWIVWNANGVATKQLFQLDKSYGADGMATRAATASIKDLKGKENGMTLKDVTVVNMEPGPAAQAFLAGQNDAAMTYEPYLSAVRDKPDAGKIIATTLDYPMVMDTFGCTPKFISENEAAVRAIVKSYYEALDMIKTDQKKAYDIMGADVKQSGEQFGKSAGFLRWSDAAGNKAFFSGEWQTFTNKAADLLLEMGLIKQKPDVATLVDTRFAAGGGS